LTKELLQYFLHAGSISTHKDVGFVSHGAAGGTRAVVHPRLIAGELTIYLPSTADRL